jgi:hypothetical protein
VRDHDITVYDDHTTTTMAQLLNNLFGGSKTTAKAVPTGDSGKFPSSILSPLEQ